MKAEQIDQALQQKFVREGERLVFWHDPNGEFADYIGAGFCGDLSEVKILDVAAVGGLSAKLRLEREDTTDKYLVYSKGEIPAAVINSRGRPAHLYICKDGTSKPVCIRTIGAQIRLIEVLNIAPAGFRD